MPQYKLGPLESGYETMRARQGLGTTRRARSVELARDIVWCLLPVIVAVVIIWWLGGMEFWRAR